MEQGILPGLDFNKDDDNKLLLSLIEPSFIEGLGEVLTDGAAKYGRENWKKLDRKEIHRYKDALLRHTNEYMKGNILDSESHHNHMLHIACNAMFLHHFDNLKK